MNREELAAALEQWIMWGGGIVVAAARERLAQLPEKCPTTHWITGECPDCHGSGKVYPAELVERIAKATYDSLTPVAVTWDQQTEGVREVYRVKAVAVLDALNGETE